MDEDIDEYDYVGDPGATLEQRWRLACDALAEFGHPGLDLDENIAELVARVRWLEARLQRFALGLYDCGLVPRATGGADCERE